VGTGARTVHATGEVGALAARFEANPHGNDKQDRPLANDLAAGLRILPATDKDALLAAILKTNEPLILAQPHNLSRRNTCKTSAGPRMAILVRVCAGNTVTLPTAAT
jgi:hypothetical protein